MKNKLTESLQGISLPSGRKKAGDAGENAGWGGNRENALKNMKRDELLEILVEVYRENETLKEKLSETEQLLAEYKKLSDRLPVLEENQKEQLELLRRLTAE